MAERKIFRKAAMGGALLGYGTGITVPEDALAARADVGDVVIERDMPGKPHKGKVLLAVHAHLDDIPYYCGGTSAKLIKEVIPVTSSEQATMKNAVAAPMPKISKVTKRKTS